MTAVSPTPGTVTESQFPVSLQIPPELLVQLMTALEPFVEKIPRRIIIQKISRFISSHFRSIAYSLTDEAKLTLNKKPKQFSTLLPY